MRRSNDRKVKSLLQDAAELVSAKLEAGLGL